MTAAVEEAMASSAWCKVIGDWEPDDPPVPLDLLRKVVTAVHAAGGQVAVHCQTAEAAATRSSPAWTASNRGCTST
ncbi:hypothetical protein [Kibdelosporangium phytohabitans]|uniref:Amidohydrolase-related domain-containing protein n=1 Tax=Kibdelosporangium phytohabitans TaxID=860235 RepID=A0A0N9I1I3_9PSEU|nr:hypothetical protein [Kibdelosporangium phytohabitans]ALG09508.1 hypothetical protein AOZ06_23695 [Kibdelosporangium phytohabitans]MBE1469189.1 hypothetical protein [Kibdelosporangium phytohabitans]